MARERFILPLGVKAGYLEARKLAKEAGGKLPSNVLHDDCLVRSSRWRGLGKYYPAWASEILIYPEIGGKFEKGKDIVDSKTGWTLPSSYVPEEATGRAGVGLFIDPEEVREEGGRVIVHPAGGPAVLSPLIQEFHGTGKVDEATRVPLALKPGSDIEKRQLCRVDGIGVMPLARQHYYHFRRNIEASYPPGIHLGVSLKAEPHLQKPEHSLALKKMDGAILFGITREKLDALIKDAEREVYAFMGNGLSLDDFVKGAGIKRLIEALKNSQ